MPNVGGFGATLPETTNAHIEQQRGELIGRFVVLDVLGTGGMGVVYAAYDPNLDRKVAIKVLRGRAMDSDESRVRLLREAQAMARIDHPNVLRVHEAGALGDEIYIAMEFAAGGTLKRWLTAKRRSLDDIIDVFMQAGRGLAAAHAAGLVHRDFKPDNVMMLPDGTARVTDFGLVSVVAEVAPPAPTDLERSLSDSTPLSQDLTRTGALMGTPAYMAPEQFQGGLLGPAVDQFAFCVALYEAVYRTRPFAGETFGDLCSHVISGDITPAPRDSDVPARVRRALLRGLSTDPRQRFPSMEKLLAELVPQAGHRRRAVVAAGATGVALIGVLGFFALRSRDEGECTGAESRLAIAWSPAQKARVAQAFGASQRPDARAVLDRLMPIVERWTQGWQQAYVGACEDTRVRRVQSEQLLDLRMQCLTRQLDEARATLDLLAAGGGDAVDHALEAARSLPSTTGCAAVTSGTPPPATVETRTAVAAIRGKLDQARALRKLGRYSTGLELARGALATARKASYQPVIGEALLEVGTLEREVADRKAAETLGEAMLVATSVGDTETAIRAAARRVNELATQPTHVAVADEIASVAGAIATHASASAEAQVELENAAANVLAHRGRRDEAHARYQHAYAIAMARLGPDAPATLATLRGMGNLAAARHKYDEEHRYFEQVLAAVQRTSGPNHPDVATALENIANADAEMGKVRDAKQLRDRALAIRLAALGPDHPEVGASYNNMGGFYSMTGDNAAAKTYFEKALVVYRKAYGEDVKLTGPLDNLGDTLNSMGDRAGARKALEESRDLLEKAYGADDPRLAQTLAKIATLARDERRFDEALALFQRAHKLIEKSYGSNDPQVVDYIGEMATTYTKMGKLPEAREMMSRTLSGISSVYGADHPRMGIGLGNYGFLQLKLDDPKGAFASFDKAREIFETKIGKNHPNVAFTLIGGAQALIRLKREAEAVPALERALSIGTAAHIAPGQLAETHYYLAVALWANPKMRTRARAEAKAAIAGYEQAHNTRDAQATRNWLRKH